MCDRLQLPLCKNRTSPEEIQFIMSSYWRMVIACQFGIRRREFYWREDIYNTFYFQHLPFGLSDGKLDSPSAFDDIAGRLENLYQYCGSIEEPIARQPFRREVFPPYTSVIYVPPEQSGICLLVSIPILELSFTGLISYHDYYTLKNRRVPNIYAIPAGSYKRISVNRVLQSSLFAVAQKIRLNAVTQESRVVRFDSQCAVRRDHYRRRWSEQFVNK